MGEPPRARLSLSKAKVASNRGQEDDAEPEPRPAFILKVEKRSNAAAGERLFLHYDDGAMAETGGDMPGNDKLYEAVIFRAIVEANGGSPLKSGGKLPEYIFQPLTEELGRRPMEKSVRKQLELAEARGRLKYRAASNEDRLLSAGRVLREPGLDPKEPARRKPGGFLFASPRPNIRAGIATY
jgi:hypothetical protein